MIHSTWGRRSGTHLNPAITLAYLRLGKIRPADALFYVLAQCGGAFVAVLLLRAALPALLPATMAPVALASPAGPVNVWMALAIEVALSTALMLMILFTSNHPAWMRWTGTLYSLLVVAIVACVSPLSGFGLNPARLLALHLPGSMVTSHWLNLLPPFLGMLLGVEAWRLVPGRPAVLCAKLAHNVARALHLQVPAPGPGARDRVAGVPPEEAPARIVRRCRGGAEVSTRRSCAPARGCRTSSTGAGTSAWSSRPGRSAAWR